MAHTPQPPAKPPSPPPHQQPPNRPQGSQQPPGARRPDEPGQPLAPPLPPAQSSPPRQPAPGPGPYPGRAARSALPAKAKPTTCRCRRPPSSAPGPQRRAAPAAEVQAEISCRSLATTIMFQGQPVNEEEARRVEQEDEERYARGQAAAQEAISRRQDARDPEEGEQYPGSRKRPDNDEPLHKPGLTAATTRTSKR